jgi:two-component system, chemotaxis family, chemotaxis protein CheY
MSYQFDKISVLVVEDNQPMAMMVKGILETFGIGGITLARNGEEGFEVFCRHNPDIVLADWMMKPMDGIRLTRLIRNEPRSPNPFVPIILMTGFSEKNRVMEARDGGVTEFLVKPFQAKDLYKRIAQVIERPRQFVRTTEFFGPDRRRRDEESFGGPWRRQTDHTLKESEE